MPEKHIVASIATESIKDNTTIEDGFMTKSEPSEVVTVVPGNTDYTKFLNFLNQMKIRYNSCFNEQKPKDGCDKFAHFTRNGKDVFDYWEIELEDCMVSYGCCVFIFDEEQNFVGVMAE